MTGAMLALFDEVDEDIEYDFRVALAGPHVGMAGCGKSWWFDTLEQAQAAAQALLRGETIRGSVACDAGRYQGLPSRCDGACPVTAEIVQADLDMTRAPGYRVIAQHDVVTYRRGVV